MACPSDDDLLAFVQRQLSPDAASSVEGHVADCVACQTAVAEAARELHAGVPDDDDEPPEAAPAVAGPGARLGRYVVLDIVGFGAMGVVYAAYDPQLDRRVAVKLLRPGRQNERELHERMLREGQAMAQLAHPNVVTVFDVGVVEQGVFLAMEFVEGETLREWLARETRPWRRVLDAFLDAGRGLAAAHRRGIVHRDFKPDNVLVGKDGRVRVTDFGLARQGEAVEPRPEAVGAVATSPSLTSTGALVGTPAYMAPEQLRGEHAGVPSDLFAFSSALYQALFHQHAFAGGSFDDLRASVLHGDLREPAQTHGVPGYVRRALRRGLALDPSDRPETMDDLLAELDARPVRKILFAVAALAAVIAVAGVVAVGSSMADARAEARRLREHAAAARLLGEEVKEMELGLRAERLLPLHDLGPAEGRVRARLVEMRGLLGGDRYDAPIHDAIGRGLVAVGDYAAAREELETAVSQGASGPDLHWALGYTLIRLHDRDLDEARRMGGPTWVAARKAVATALYVPAAKAHLARSRGARLASPELLEALLAYQAGDLDAALAAARAAARAAPLFYEARVLVGRIFEARAVAALERRDYAGFEGRLDEALAALEAAAEIGRSDAAIYEAIAGLWFRRLEVHRYENRLADRLARVAVALLATDRALGAAPGRASGYTRRAQVHHMAAQMDSAVPDTILVRHLDACIAAARAAVARDPRDGLAFDTLGNCLLYRSRFGGLDPLPWLRSAVAAHVEAQRVSPGFPWAANDRCNTSAYIALAEWQDGVVDEEAVRRGLAACVLASRLDPSYGNPYVSAIYGLVALAGAAADRGTWDPALEARARENIRAVAPLSDDGAVNARINMLPLVQHRLEHDAALGLDLSAPRAQLLEDIDEIDRLLSPEWRGGEADVALDEARATEALAAAETATRAAPFIERCLAQQPRRFACRLLEIRAAWLSAPARALERARALVAENLGSARVWALLAETHLRLGDDRAAALAAVTVALKLSPSFAVAQRLRERLLAP